MYNYVMYLEGGCTGCFLKKDMSRPDCSAPPSVCPLSLVVDRAVGRRMVAPRSMVTMRASWYVITSSHHDIITPALHDVITSQRNHIAMYVCIDPVGAAGFQGAGPGVCPQRGGATDPR
jgi:hypothetical protein